MIGLVDRTSLSKANQLGIDISGGISRGGKRNRSIVVFAEIFPGVHKSGFALRSHVVWWLHTGEIIFGMEFNIHHKNKNRMDDRFRNLEKMTHLEHLKLHNPKQPKVLCVCIFCHNQFFLPKWYLNNPSKGRFCSEKCYHNFPKQISERRRLLYKRGYSKKTRKKMSESQKKRWMKLREN